MTLIVRSRPGNVETWLMRWRHPVIIVNADDFGYSVGVNSAILAAFDAGCCTSATIMANMPGFDAACELALARRFADRVGIHFVLTEGHPLTVPIRRCERFCSGDGRFCLTRKRRLWRLSRPEKTAVADELRAQIVRCRRHGLPLPHADSHNHVHEEWGILSLMIRVCQEEGIRYIRIARNCGESTGRGRSFYRYLINRRLRQHGLARTDWFGSMTDVRRLFRTATDIDNERSVEIMIHPQLSENGRLLDNTPPNPPAPLPKCPILDVVAKSRNNPSPGATNCAARRC